MFLVSGYLVPHEFFEAIPASLRQVALNLVRFDFSRQESFAAVLTLDLHLADLHMVMELTLCKYFLAGSAAGLRVAICFMVVKISQWVWVLTESTPTRLWAIGLMFIDFIRTELDSTSSAARVVPTLRLVLFNNPQRENIAAKFASSRFKAGGFVLLNFGFWEFKPTVSTPDTILAMGLMAFQSE